MVKGQIRAETVDEVTISCAMGLLTINKDQLSPETLKQLLTDPAEQVPALLKRIAELENTISVLQREIEHLKAQTQSSGQQPAMTQSASAAVTQRTPTASSTGQFHLSSTGKRHNSGCRYFSSGRPCGPNDGVPCKNCGG